MGHSQSQVRVDRSVRQILAGVWHMQMTQRIAVVAAHVLGCASGIGSVAFLVLNARYPQGDGRQPSPLTIAWFASLVGVFVYFFWFVAYVWPRTFAPRYRYFWIAPSGHVVQSATPAHTDDLRASQGMPVLQLCVGGIRWFAKDRCYGADGMRPAAYQGQDDHNGWRVCGWRGGLVGVRDRAGFTAWMQPAVALHALQFDGLTDFTTQLGMDALAARERTQGIAQVRTRARKYVAILDWAIGTFPKTTARHFLRDVAGKLREAQASIVPATLWVAPRYRFTRGWIITWAVYGVLLAATIALPATHPKSAQILAMSVIAFIVGAVFGLVLLFVQSQDASPVNALAPTGAGNAPLLQMPAVHASGKSEGEGPRMFIIAHLRLGTRVELVRPRLLAGGTPAAIANVAFDRVGGNWKPVAYHPAQFGAGAYAAAMTTRIELVHEGRTFIVPVPVAAFLIQFGMPEAAWAALEEGMDGEVTGEHAERAALVERMANAPEVLEAYAEADSAEQREQLVAVRSWFAIAGDPAAVVDPRRAPPPAGAQPAPSTDAPAQQPAAPEGAAPA